MNKNVPDVRLAYPPDENPHYLRAVTQVGDVQEVIAHADIFESNGIKLVAKGARIDSRLFQRLTQHRRAAPLDSGAHGEASGQYAQPCSGTGQHHQT